MTFSITLIKDFLKNKGAKAWLGASALVLAMTFGACSSDDDNNPVLGDVKSILIEDMAGDLETSMGTAAIDPNKVKGDFETFLFSFADKRQYKEGEDKDAWEKLQKSTDWDLAFTGPYNSEIYINSATQKGSPGFGGAAKNSAVVLIKDDYRNVSTAPSDEEFDKSNVSKIGWSAIENDHGWYQYSETTHIMKTLPNRTYAIRLANGKYAKLQILSAYKGNPPAVTDLNWPAPYYTFRYFVQQDGSKDLNTK